jgi:hypothetical protein
MPSSRTQEGSWITEELKGVEFGDVRVNRRFEKVALDLAHQPSLPINQASHDWAATKGAYRLFENPQVTPEEILSPHYSNTNARLKGRKRAVVVQDTSVIDFSRHKKTTGLGFTTTYGENHREAQGLMFHTSLALTEKGVPLGLVSHEIYAKKHSPTRNEHERTKIPLAQKDSFKWFKALRSSLKNTSSDEAPEMVMVCDREADIYELFQEAQMLARLDLVVRLQHDRMCWDEELGDHHIYERLAIEEPRGHVEVRLPSNGKRKARKALLAVRFAKVVLSAHPRGIKTNRVAHREDLELWVVDLREEASPPKQEALEWTLVTTLEVSGIRAALEVMQLYKMRWTIELYFKCLKTGCNVEGCRLGSAEKIINYISLLSVVAWRILWMTMLGRERSEESCESVFSEIEWKTLWLQHHRPRIKRGEMGRTPPEKPPRLKEAIQWLAMKGGYLARKSDPPPGLTAIWRGWLRLLIGAEVYELVTAPV